MVVSEADVPPNFRAEDREQVLLLPPVLEDYVPEGHLARFVREVVEQFDSEGRLAPFYESYRADGRGGKAFHVRSMLGVLLYALAQGVTSSRRIARDCRENLAFRYLASNQCPDFRSIAKFRKRHLEAFGDLFRDVLKLCDAVGLVELGRVSIDGRRVRGNASRDKTLTAEALDKQIVELSNELLAAAEAQDAKEDAELGDDDSDDLPPDFRTKQERLTRLKQARKVIEDRERKLREQYEEKVAARKQFEAETGSRKSGRPPEPPNTTESKNTKAPPKANTTDPDSRLLKVRQGYVQGYNAQVAVDSKAQIIVSHLVTQDVIDTRQFVPVLDGIKANLGRLPKQAVADAGYWSPDNVDEADLRNVDAFIATKKDSKQRKAAKVETAPKGRIPGHLNPRERMERKLLTVEGKAAYRTRGPTVEATFGQQVMRGLTGLLLRGREAVAAEWSLWCTTHNLLKLWRSGAVLT